MPKRALHLAVIYGCQRHSLRPGDVKPILWNWLVPSFHHACDKLPVWLR